MNDTHRASIPATDLEPASSDESVGEEEAEGLDTRVNIRVISYRKHNHDTDGVSIKAVLDGLVRRGVLPNDSAKEIRRVSFESIQSDEEKTVIEISPCQTPRGHTP